MSLAAGTRLGPYEILGTLGVGGMGEVYRARDPRFRREVAIKVMPDDVAHDPVRLKRFEHEARAAGALNHPNVLTVHDFGTDSGTVFLVTELLEGDTLRDHLSRGAIQLEKAVDWAVQVARGLAAAHEKGIVHRDLKPENLFVTKDARAKILDFGLARLGAAPAGSVTLTLTETGVTLGTAGYMAPEQIRGEPADHRADLFAFGCVLYELLAGRRAFPGELAVQVMSAILSEEPRPLAELRPELPAGLERLVRRCLEKTREARFQSATDLAFALETLAASGGVQAAGESRAQDMLSERPVLRRITFRNGYVDGARFTPEGQGVVYGAAWEGRPFEIFTSRPGSPESRSLGLPPGNLLDVSATGEMAVSLGFTHSFWFKCEGTLARTSLAGGGVRLLQKEVGHADWAPDGRSLAISRYVGGHCRLEYPAGKVLRETTEWLSHVRVSPDGARVAFADHSVLGDSGGVVCVADAAGTIRRLTPELASLTGIAWSPRGDEVLLSGIDDRLQCGLWAVRLDGTRRQLLSGTGRVRLHDAAADGRVLLSTESMRSGIHSGTEASGMESNLSWFDGSIIADISADGRQLLFTEAHEAENPHFGVYLRAVDGSPAVRLGDGAALRLSPDGESALGVSFPSRTDLFVYPTGLGETRSLEIAGIDRYAWAGWHPDGRQVYVVGSSGGRANRLHVQAVAGGGPQCLCDEEIHFDWWRGLPISPDGDTLALRRDDGSGALFSANAREFRPLPGLRPQDTPLRFDSSGRFLLVWHHEEPVPRIDRLDLASGERSAVREVSPPDPTGIIYVASPCVTPDGHRYAYTFMRILTDLYVVEGLV